MKILLRNIDGKTYGQHLSGTLTAWQQDIYGRTYLPAPLAIITDARMALTTSIRYNLTELNATKYKDAAALYLNDSPAIADIYSCPSITAVARVGIRSAK